MGRLLKHICYIWSQYLENDHWILLHENVLVRTAIIMQQFVIKIEVSVLHHTLYQALED